MANIKLTDNNWEASGVYDLAQQKTQRQINADVNTALGNKAGKAVIAPDYSASSTYAVGDYVMYNGSLYRCSTAISTAEAWTAAHWTESKIGTDVSALKSALNTLTPAATAGDVGKALIVKTVDPTTGKPSAYEYGEAGGGGDVSDCAPVIVNAASGAFVHITDGADAMPVKDLAISGADSATVIRTGKNMLDRGKLKFYNGSTRFLKYGVNTYSDNVPNGDCFLGKGTYTLSISGDNTENAETLAVRDSTGNNVGIAYNNKVLTVNVPETGAYFIAINFTGAIQINNYNFQFEYGSAASEFESYTGTEFEYPTEPVNTLYGVNNIWSDTGTINISYCADTKLYVDKKIAELQATMLENIGG